MKDKKMASQQTGSRTEERSIRSQLLTGPVAPPTSAFSQEDCSERLLSFSDGYKANFHPLYMRWSSVAHTNGNPRGQMEWVIAL
jgi:hypothetical protein